MQLLFRTYYKYNRATVRWYCSSTSKGATCNRHPYTMSTLPYPTLAWPIRNADERLSLTEAESFNYNKVSVNKNTNTGPSTETPNSTFWRLTRRPANPTSLHTQDHNDAKANATWNMGRAAASYPMTAQTKVGQRATRNHICLL